MSPAATCSIIFCATSTPASCPAPLRTPDEHNRCGHYAFCVYEESKAVIGDVFALPGRLAEPDQDLNSTPAELQPVREVEILKHLFETLQNSPHVDRIESQLLLHPSGAHAACFRRAGF